MGRQGTKLHKWTSAEEALLVETIEAAQAHLTLYERNGRAREGWWDLVAGMLAVRTEGKLVVTGGACERRTTAIEARKRDAAEQVAAEQAAAEQRVSIEPAAAAKLDAWDETWERVQVYEQGLLESTSTQVDQLATRISDLLMRVSALDHQVSTVRDVLDLHGRALGRVAMHIERIAKDLGVV